MQLSKEANSFSACREFEDEGRGMHGGGKGNAQNYFLVVEE